MINPASTTLLELRLNSIASPSINTSGFREHFVYHINNLPYQNDRIRYDDLRTMLRNFHLHPTEIATDLFLIACLAYAADTRVNRYKVAQDSWTRSFMLIVPVSDKNIWDQQRELLQSILQFLTGDFWGFDFVQRDATYEVFATTNNSRSQALSYQPDTVCLFSGGMDSFIGAFELLENGVRPLLVGHAKSNDVSEFRNSTYQKIRGRYAENPPELIRAYVRIDKQTGLTGREDTERGRSFLFLVLGLLCASSLQSTRTRLIVPENGLISLNLPLTPLRLGSYSTRTTHPFLLKEIQSLATGLGFNTEIVNPYELKTKGEMLAESPDPQFVVAAETMSCSRPATRNAHLEGKGHKHCGRCVPCIIRRASLKAAGISDDIANLPTSSKYRFDILNEVVNASDVKGENVMAFKYLVNKILMQPNYLTASIRLTGKLENTDEFIEMYRRGLAEVKGLLDLVQVQD